MLRALSLVILVVIVVMLIKRACTPWGIGPQLTKLPTIIFFVGDGNGGNGLLRHGIIFWLQPGYAVIQSAYDKRYSILALTLSVPVILTSKIGNVTDTAHQVFCVDINLVPLE
jgi:hypothetical protein